MLGKRKLGRRDPKLEVRLHEQGAAKPVSLVVSLRPTDAAPVALARRLGVAPAWLLTMSADGMVVRLPRETFEARLRDPSAPEPEGAYIGLARMWGSHWRLLSEPDAPLVSGILFTETAGAYSVTREGEEVELGRMAGYGVVRFLLFLGGFQVGRF